MHDQPIRSFQVDQMPVHVFASGTALGQRAAVDLADLLRQTVSRQGHAAIILATGNSQLEFMRALRSQADLPWSEVSIFHMDEYLGMSDQHPASFARYIRDKLVDWVKPRAFYPLRGDAPDAQQELQRYANLLRQCPPDVCVLGIGENGHLAFNDPPANFEIAEIIHLVNLDEACRRQQVGEGHFASLDETPCQALSLTVPMLLSARHVLGVVPEARKAQAVYAALRGPLTPLCPASILRTRPHVTLYLDTESARLL